VGKSRPPGARVFSRLPNDKKGKALGTRLLILLISFPNIFDKLNEKASVDL
jgi:hypothetical protein